MLKAMNDIIVGAIIGAAATLVVGTLPVLLFLLSERKRRKDAEADARKRELNALQRIIDMSHGIGVLEPWIADSPDRFYFHLAELRDTVVEALGALPPDSEARPTLAAMQSAIRQLRQSYRRLERPVGEPALIKVTSDEFKPYLLDFQTDFAALLADLRNRILSPAQANT
jgi:hypothetical protein